VICLQSFFGDLIASVVICLIVDIYVGSLLGASARLDFHLSVYEHFSVVFL